MSSTFRGGWRLMLGPSLPWPVGLGVGLIVLGVVATIGVPAAQRNLRNLTLIRQAPLTTETGLPICSSEQQPISAAATASADPATALFLARSAMLQGACGASLALLDSVQTDEAARLRASLCLAQRQYACVQQALAVGARNHGDVAWWLAEHAQRLAASGDNLSAAPVFELARSFGDLTIVQRREYANALLATGDSAAAIDALRDALRDDPTDSSLYDALASALWTAHPGDPEAVTLEERAVQLRDYFPYRYRLGAFYLSEGRLPDAEVQFQQVLAVGVARVDALEALGLVTSAEGRLTEAAGYYHRALQEADRPATTERLAEVCAAIEQAQHDRPIACTPS